MKKILSIILVCVISFSLVSCEKKIVMVNVENQENIQSAVIGKDALIEIGGYLYYDSTTRIVYWWNGVLNNMTNGDLAPTPYYTPNGLHYRYNPESNTFEEIAWSDMNETD